MKPVRVQRKRTKGWKMPPNTVYVGRGTKWGNPFAIGSTDRQTGGRLDAEASIERYLQMLHIGQLPFKEGDAAAELVGKNLACWCPLDRACHADALLEVANP